MSAAAWRGPAWRGALAVAVICIAVLVSAQASGASTTFGDSLGVPESIIVAYPGCGEPCTLATTVSPERLSYFRSPETGTIVRWRIQTIAGSTAQMIALRVLAPVAGDTFTEALSEPFTGAGTSEAVAAPTAAGTFTFATKLPVQAGDFIGLNTEGEALAAVAVEEESIRVFQPPPSDFGAASPGIHQNYALLVNADVVGNPTSSAVPACSRNGSFDVTVTPDPDPTVSAKALHARVDGGPEQILPTAGAPARASILLAQGSHSLEYWGEDSFGQQESAHHDVTVSADDSPPAIAIWSNQGRSIYPQGATASVTANDAGSGLQVDPSTSQLPLATSKPGAFTITRTAIDRCGNSASASFAYSVTPAARLSYLRLTPRTFPIGKASLRSASKRHTKSGSEIAYSDSRQALATFVIQRALHGVRRKGRCVAARTKSNGHVHTCTRFASIASFSHDDNVGINRLRFSGRIGGVVLAPGSYRLRAWAHERGGAPGPVSYASFHVIG